MERNIIKKNYHTLEFDQILAMLEEYAYTNSAKNKLKNLEPFLSETDLAVALRETTEARMIIETIGTPPLVSLESMNELLITASQGGCLLPEQLEYIGLVLTAVRRMKDFLNRGKYLEIGLPYYEVDLDALEDVREEILQKIRGQQVDDYASKLLKNLRSDIEQTESKMQQKAENLLKSNKECFSDSFVVKRSGHLCLPVKKEHKFRISGSVIDKSSTGATLFIEPTIVATLSEELSILRLDEENEVRRILYELTSLIADHNDTFLENIRVLEKLDFIFAKGKLSFDMKAVQPEMTLERKIEIVNGRHPFLAKDKCVPLNFTIGDHVRGVVITGPNTGGKTVSIKTVGLLSLMAQSGLHVPCDKGIFTMNNAVLCDIGDGQDITENLSTFSSHITNVLAILKVMSKDSLIIMDELGSGTDPTEGMGIAISILEELRKCGCLFLCTTHYPEVKQYANKVENVINARMAFDRESLRPTYRLEIGEAGESCALYIAKRLGMSNTMLKRAKLEAYGDDHLDFLNEDEIEEKAEKAVLPTEMPGKIQRKKAVHVKADMVDKYDIGDSVMIYPDKKIGIVCKKVDEKGVIQVQLRDKKIFINQKRVKLHVKAKELYPDDYDFSIIFDSVETRKARHQMSKHHMEGLEIVEESTKQS